MTQKRARVCRNVQKCWQDDVIRPSIDINKMRLFFSTVSRQNKIHSPVYLTKNSSIIASGVDPNIFSSPKNRIRICTLLSHGHKALRKRHYSGYNTVHFYLSKGTLKAQYIIIVLYRRTVHCSLLGLYRISGLFYIRYPAGYPV